MPALPDSFRAWVQRPTVRPWGLVGPILVLMICLPMLRPLRHPAELSDDEAIRLSTIRALAEKHTLAIEPAHAPASHAVIKMSRTFSDQPPVFAILLAGPYWLMMRGGITFNSNPVLTPYLLTLLGTTVPVALVAALIYRMARMFELRRPWRAVLAVTTVLGSGLLSYATVLNPHAAAAAMVMGAVGCIVHVTTAKKSVHSGTWFMISGLCAALATTFDPPAAIIGVGLIFVILAIRLRPWMRIAGVFLFLLGTTPPLALHAVASMSSTRHLIPLSLVRDLSGHLSVAAPAPAPISNLDTSDDDDLAGRSWWLVAGKYINRWLAGFLGSHGLFSHFPVLIFGACGLAAVMHRNWPGWTKMLAAVTALGALSVIGLYCCSQADWREAMFASRWFVLFVPLVLFWTGAWLRREHGTFTWTIAGLLLAFSACVTVIGATNPYPRQGFDRYTAVGALMQLIHENGSTPSGASLARANFP